nr:MAG TPA: hypothetical protein [Caudoviricetes sp.]
MYHIMRANSCRTKYRIIKVLSQKEKRRPCKRSPLLNNALLVINSLVVFFGNNLTFNHIRLGLNNLQLLLRLLNCGSLLLTFGQLVLDFTDLVLHRVAVDNLLDAFNHQKGSNAAQSERQSVKASFRDFGIILLANGIEVESFDIVQFLLIVNLSFVVFHNKNLQNNINYKIVIYLIIAIEIFARAKKKKTERCNAPSIKLYSDRHSN